MALQTFPVLPEAQVEVKVEGDLLLSTCNEMEIQLQVEDIQGLHIESRDQDYIIHCESDLDLKVPETVRINIKSVDGSTSVTGHFQELLLLNVGGNLTLRETNKVVVQNVGGNLRAFNLNGDLNIHNIGGNLKAGQISGAVEAQNVGGNIKMGQIFEVNSLRAGGNVRLQMSALTHDVNVNAGGNIKLYLPQGQGYQLRATSGGEKVVILNQGENKKATAGVYNGVFNGGGVPVILTAGGNIAVMDSGWEEEFEEGTTGSPEEDIFGEWAAFSSHKIEARIHEKIRRAEERSRRAAQQAEQRVREAEDRVREVMDRMDMGIFNAFSPNASQAMPDEGQPESRINDEERLIVLNMLREKKITAEEADRLLDALEGKFNHPEG